MLSYCIAPSSNPDNNDSVIDNFLPEVKTFIIHFVDIFFLPKLMTYFDDNIKVFFFIRISDVLLRY